MKIIKYDSKYRDDLIFMVLEAKNALGRVPTLNQDMLDIQGAYFDKGDMFWLALDDNDRVIGSIGYSSLDGTDEVQLHRLYVKANLKHQRIGTKLLQIAENHIKECEKTAIHIHLGEPKEQWFESRNFYSKHGYKYTNDENTPYMVKQL